MIASHLDDAVKGTAIDDAGGDGRYGDGPNGPEGQGRITGGLADSGERWDSRMRDGEIGAQLRPRHAAVGGGQEILIAGEQLAPPVPCRKYDGKVEGGAQLERWILLRPHINPRATGIADLRDAQSAREDDIGIKRIGKDRAPLPGGYRLPVDGRDRPQVAATARGDGAGVLLRRVNPIGKRVVGGDVIDLLGGVVVLRALGVAAIERDDGPLVVAHEYPLAIGRIDPYDLRIVTAGRAALEGHEAVTAIGGLVSRHMERVDDVGVFRVDGDTGVIAALTVGDPLVVRRHLPPRRAAIVGAVESEVADEIDALSVRAHRDRERDATREAGQP